MRELIKIMIPEKIKIVLWKLWYVLFCKKKNQIEKLFAEYDISKINEIPIFIINFNRLSYVKLLVANLEQRGYLNIHIIDNNSTYPPLLKYYDDCRYDVIRLKENKGHMVFWKDEYFSKYRESFYVVTDPDVLPIEECPNDFVLNFFECLRKYPWVRKVGFSLKIDDLPQDSILSEDAYNWEKQFYKTKLKKENIYYAGIDTTFALYMPDNYIVGENFGRAFRTGMPYVARHLPWYKKASEVTEEDIYYSTHKTNGWWDFVKGEVTPDGQQIKIRRNN